MARVGFFYPSRSMRLPVDVSVLWTDSRGLTGSEVSFFMYALGLARMGHGVTIFTKMGKAGDLGPITCVPYEEWASEYCRQPWDALVSWMTPEPLQYAPDGAFRLFNQQVSDFGHCDPGWESWVDLIAPLSHSHALHLEPMCSLPRSKWRIMYNGVDVEAFRPADKIPGKMVWASSHDRGLHWLLEAFPKIKNRVPDAELHVFYDPNGMKAFSGVGDLEPNVLLRELGSRSRYCLEALRRLDGYGVHFSGSVSRDAISAEVASAQVLAYPCDPVRYTETFGVTVLEALACGTVPVICTADAFGELWGPVCPSVPPPYSAHKSEYVDLVVRALTDPRSRAADAARGVRHAQDFAWGGLVSRLDSAIRSRGQSGLPTVNWS